MNKFKSILVVLAAAMLAIACQKESAGTKVQYLDVTPNNLVGKWQLVEFNGEPLVGGTYFYIEFVRKDRKFTIWQNFDSISNNAHVETGTFNITTDVEFGAIIIGRYDNVYDGGHWSHKYEVNDLTSDSMTWVVAYEDNVHVQKFVRVDDIPVK